ncbi:hypothetical protein WJX74_000207 [Apatococcus lobatus]|uniref:non-specific serine/threonine protein kinase n=1 Tax=Apatococcus lobatus TaxID=904363 RepID=A0AAW1RY00_9CHLO
MYSAPDHQCPASLSTPHKAFNSDPGLKGNLSEKAESITTAREAALAMVIGILCEDNKWMRAKLRAAQCKPKTFTRSSSKASVIPTNVIGGAETAALPSADSSIQAIPASGHSVSPTVNVADKQNPDSGAVSIDPAAFAPAASCMDGPQRVAIADSMALDMAARETEVMITTRSPNFTYLDSGAFGVVYRVSCKGLPDVAVKMQKREHAVEEMANFEATEGCRFCIQMCPPEDNDALGGLLSDFLCQTPEEADQLLSIAMPYYQHGSLYHFLTEHVVHKPPLPFTILKAWLLQQISVMRDLEIRGLSHNDIKPGNWLVDAEGCLALSDLGGLQKGTWIGHRSKAPPIVTLLYSPPEYFQGQTPKGHENDAWALGWTFHAAATGVNFFSYDEDQEVYTQAVAGDDLRGNIACALRMLETVYPDADPQDLKMMRIVLRQLVHEDPDKRVGGVHGMTFVQLEQQLRDDCHWDDRVDQQEFAAFVSSSKGCRAEPEGHLPLPLAMPSPVIPNQLDPACSAPRKLLMIKPKRHPPGFTNPPGWACDNALMQQGPAGIPSSVPLPAQQLETACPAAPMLVKSRRRPPGFTNPSNLHLNGPVMQGEMAAAASPSPAPLPAKQVQKDCPAAPMLVKPRRRPPGFPMVPGTSSRFPKLPVVTAAPATPELPKPRRRPPGFTKVQEPFCHQPDMRMQLGGAAPACPPPIPVVFTHAQPMHHMVAHAVAAEGSMPRRRPPGFANPPGFQGTGPVMQLEMAAAASPCPAPLSAQQLEPACPAASKPLKPWRRPPGFPVIPGNSDKFSILPLVVAAPVTPELPKPRRRPPGFTKIQEPLCHQPDMWMGGAAPACPAPILVVLANAQPMVAHAAAAEESMPRRRPPGFVDPPGFFCTQAVMQMRSVVAATPSSAHMPLQLACPATPELPKPKRRPPGITQSPGSCCCAPVLHAEIAAPACALVPPMPAANTEPPAAAAAAAAEGPPEQSPAKPRRRLPVFEALAANVNVCNASLTQMDAAASQLPPVMPSLVLLPGAAPPASPGQGKPAGRMLGSEAPPARAPAAMPPQWHGRDAVERAISIPPAPAPLTPLLAAACPTQPQPKKARREDPMLETLQGACKSGIMTSGDAIERAAPPAPVCVQGAPLAAADVAAACLVGPQPQKPRRKPPGFENYKGASNASKLTSGNVARAAPGPAAPMMPNEADSPASCVMASKTISMKPRRKPPGFEDFQCPISKTVLLIEPEQGAAERICKRDRMAKRGIAASADAHLHCICRAAKDACLNGCAAANAIPQDDAGRQQADAKLAKNIKSFINTQNCPSTGTAAAGCASGASDRIQDIPTAFIKYALQRKARPRWKLHRQACTTRLPNLLTRCTGLLEAGPSPTSTARVIAAKRQDVLQPRGWCIAAVVGCRAPLAGHRMLNR